jgi:two-component system OmpR family response regulator
MADRANVVAESQIAATRMEPARPPLSPPDRSRYGQSESDAMKILLIEDDREAAEYLTKALTESGYVVDHAAEGRDGLFLATSGTYDALIVDRMLPGMDGLAIVAALRAAEIRTPTLILSALGAVDDRVKGLRAGGDDYLVKPYAFS